MRFGAYLRSQRIASGATMREFADRIGIAITTLSDIELGRRAPLAGARLRLAMDALKGADPHVLATLSAKERGEVSMPVDGMADPRIGNLALLLDLAGRLDNGALHRVLDAAVKECDAGHTAKARGANP